MEVVAIIAVFAVLIFFVASGKLKPRSVKVDEAIAEGNAKSEGKASGVIEKAYLIAADGRNQATFEIHYASKGVAVETVVIHTPRYETLKKYEPERVGFEGSLGNDIAITYADGHVVKCLCSWMNWEAAQMRDDMLVEPSGEQGR